ncbi:nucleoside transporter-domain-containing protein [Obelidium mucronatum]|nr:nucleoside transporter-domain-containing protein [Obelidium mucronatum]
MASSSPSYLISLLLGVTGLAAWNAWITSVPLFHRRLAGTPYAATFEAWISLVFSVSNLAGLSLVLLVKTDALLRLKAGLFLHGFVFVFVLFLLQFELEATLFFGLVLVCVAASAVSAALQMAAFAVLAWYKAPVLCSNAISAGQGVAGLAVSILAAVNVVTKLDNDEAMFVVAVILAGASVWGLHVLPGSAGEEVEGLVQDDLLDEGDSFLPVSRISVLWAVKEYGFAILWDFTVTLAVFPALAASIKSVRYDDPNAPSLFKELFVPIMFVVFNLGDLTGKFMPGWKGFKLPGKHVTLWFSLLRVLFIPLLMCCNVPQPSIFPRIFGDAEFMFIILMLGITNGWIASDIMMHGPMSISESYGVEGQGIAADGLVFMLTLGLAVGGASSMLFV